MGTIGVNGCAVGGLGAQGSDPRKAGYPGGLDAQGMDAQGMCSCPHSPPCCVTAAQLSGSGCSAGPPAAGTASAAPGAPGFVLQYPKDKG